MSESGTFRRSVDLLAEPSCVTHPEVNRCGTVADNSGIIASWLEPKCRVRSLLQVAHDMNS